MKRRLLLVLVTALAAAGCGRKVETAAREQSPASATDDEAYQADAITEAKSRPPVPIVAFAPEMNARRGRILFTTKGCVVCHQVNGVGGLAGPALAAPAVGGPVNPLEFSARIWRGAPAMAALQEADLGYVIELDAQDLADLAAFAASPAEQLLVTYESVPEPLRDWFINTPYWKGGDWSEYGKRGENIPLADDRN